MTKLQLIFEHDELVSLQTGIIIEVWDKVMSTGRGKRELKTTFNEEEIKKLRRYYNLFYGWNFRAGHPMKGYTFDEPSDYELTQKFVAFFARF